MKNCKHHRTNSTKSVPQNKYDVDGNVDDKMDTSPAKDVKCMKRKTHAMSQSDGEEEDEEPAATPAKKVKTDDSSKNCEPADEKKVKKVRTRCRYWEKCYQKNKVHVKEFIHPGDSDATDDTPKKKKAYIPGHISISVLLAQKYVKDSINPVGWWMSEKLDGVRAYWNGRCFYSRLGNAFIAPEWFTKDLPTDMHLDGELFGGRGKFQSTVSIVKTPEDDRWKKIKYHVFDTPNMGTTVFEKRYEELENYFAKSTPKYAVLCEQTKCTGEDHIDEDMDEVLALGGEGLMLRQPKSQYEKRRSPTLLKIKKFHDAEAVVIAHEPGKPGTKNQYLCGALRCRMECGKEFSVGSGLTDAQRKKPPKIGTIITYKFQEYTNSGSPRFPTFVGVRIDADGPKDVILPKKPSDD